MKRIPISTAQHIAKTYNYHQVVVVARAVGVGGGEWCTTYGTTKENCVVAAHIGRYFTERIMEWPSTPCVWDSVHITTHQYHVHYLQSGCGKRGGDVGELNTGGWKFCPYCGKIYVLKQSSKHQP